MSWLSKLFGGGENPMNSANQYLNQIPGVGHEGYDPYINRGNTASDKLSGEYGKLIDDPTGFINKLMEGYKPSEGYQFQKGELQKEMGNNAAAGGVAGTAYDTQQQGKAIQGLLSQDMQQFLQNVLGRYDTGLKGEQGFADKGFDATKQLTDLLGGALNQQGGLAFQNAQQKNQNKNDMWHMFGKVLGAGAGAFLGGAPGAKVGSSIFS